MGLFSEKTYDYSTTRSVTELDKAIRKLQNNNGSSVPQNDDPTNEQENANGIIQ